MFIILPEADTTAPPIVPHIDCTNAIVQLKVISVEQGTLLWTVPCFPFLTIERRKTKSARQNGVLQKAIMIFKACNEIWTSPVKDTFMEP